jgi:acetoin utilization deacetylase AcuC-like enzyme
MGFCFFNNIAVAASHLIETGAAERVLVVDFDVHHGNGTQDAFYEDPRVHFFSSHRYPFYPGSGAADECGRGAGAGATTNLPLAFGTDPEEQITHIEDRLTEVAARVKPEWILVSAGFDAFARDPVGNLGWEEEHYHRWGVLVAGLAAAHAGDRLISLLEGGYNVAFLPALIRAYLNGVADRRRPPQP